jgi:hypothetical protein
MRGLRGRAKEGFVPSGNVPLGYESVRPETKGAHYVINHEEASLVQRISLNFSHIWPHPALQGQCLLMAVRGTTARLYPASCSEGRCPLRHDGICALPPQHFDDLMMVFVLTRLRKSRSDLSRHQDIIPYATVWKGLCSVGADLSRSRRGAYPVPHTALSPDP